MNQFTIRDIENLSGIKAHTIRMWEQRYNIMIPKRKESNHRFYDNEDLKQILRISFLYHNGIKISKIARFNNDEINKVIGEHKLLNEHDFYITNLVEASIDFDEVRFEEVIDNAITQNGLEASMIKIIYPFLEKIGLLWVTENLIPAQEHFSSNIINRKILSAIDGLGLVNYKNDNTTLLFTPQNEHHEIPILFINYLLKKNGNKVIYFGDSIKINDIEIYHERKKVTHLHFHLITNFIDKDLNTYVEELAAKFKDVQIIISGPMVNKINNNVSNVRLLTSMQQILDYAMED